MLPLTRWEIFARELPEEMTGFTRPSGFVLPGAKALEGFADLLGGSAESDSLPQPEGPEPESAPFALPAMLPEALEGPVSLRREIDFGGLIGDRVMLTIDHIIGNGRILLGERTLCAFDSARFTADALGAAHDMTAQPCMLAVDLTDALELGRKETLIIAFDERRPAGLPGPVMLHATSGASMTRVSLMPDAREQTVEIRALVTAKKPGHYVLRAQAFTQNAQANAARETALTLEAGEAKQVQFSLPLACAPFMPGVPFNPPAVKIQLFARKEKAHTEGLLCDSATLIAGHAVKAPENWVPLDHASAFCNPRKTIDQLKALRVPAVSLSIPAPDSLYRALSRAGIAVRQYMPKDHPLHTALCRLPCVSLTDAPEPDAAVSLEASAWQMCSMISAPRMLDEALTARELLLEASGMPLDSKDEGVRNVLLWLRSVSVRLRAEASRRQRYFGALCTANEWKQDDIADALRTAFAPLHLSALPLCGAWWTGTHFSASLEAFIPKDTFGSDARLTARAVLEDSEGTELARLEAPCRHIGGYVGVIEAALPDHPCVLELTAQLVLAGEVIEESTLPVYVGERGPLEAAFV